VSRNIVSGEERIFDTPAGRLGNVIAGTDIQFLVTEEGKVGIKKTGEPFREVLAGTKPLQSVAVANDLSLFGGVDDEKRLWVQHGLDRPPEILATGVTGVLWGPISRRVLVQEANHKSRIYDGRDNTWIDLGEVSLAQWSSDEERLLFVGSGDGAKLSLLSNSQLEQLCDMNRIGPTGRIVFSADGEKAFLLASLTGKLDVWMISLPPRALP
jgi:WD40 repeat protein